MRDVFTISFSTESCRQPMTGRLLLKWLVTGEVVSASTLNLRRFVFGAKKAKNTQKAFHASNERLLRQDVNRVMSFLVVQKKPYRHSNLLQRVREGNIPQCLLILVQRPLRVLYVRQVTSSAINFISDFSTDTAILTSSLRADLLVKEQVIELHL